MSMNAVQNWASTAMQHNSPVEELDAKTFGSWDIDYLKYDYCNAPEDAGTAQQLYGKMAQALREDRKFKPPKRSILP